MDNDKSSSVFIVKSIYQYQYRLIDFFEAVAYEGVTVIWEETVSRDLLYSDVPNKRCRASWIPTGRV